MQIDGSYTMITVANPIQGTCFADDGGTPFTASQANAAAAAASFAGAIIYDVDVWGVWE